MPPPRPHHTTRATMRLVLLAAVCTFLLAACDDTDPPKATTVASTPTAEPTPTPVADPEAAAALRAAGEYEQAIAVYAAVANATVGDERRQALFAQAQLEEKTGLINEARATLTGYFATTVPASDGNRSTARYLEARVLVALGQPIEGLAAYDAYIAAAGVLAPYARAERAKLLAATGLIVEAQAAAEEAVIGLPLSDDRNTFMLQFARTLDDAGFPAEALAWYVRVRTAGGDIASALASEGAIKRRLGDPSWIDDYQTLVAAYPGRTAASTALDVLDADGVPVSPYARGYVQYRSFQNDAARESFDAAIIAGDHAAESTYYLAAIDERFDDAASAIDRYTLVPALDPTSHLADDSLWWRGRLLQVGERWSEAIDVYSTLIAQYPASEWAEDAAFHRALAFFRSGDHAAAAFGWGALASAATEDARARALFWQGRAEDAADNPQSEQTLALVQSEFPGNFYALRAEVLLNDNDGDAEDADMDPPPIDWTTVAAAVEQAIGGVPDASIALSPEDARWAMAGALEDAGQRVEADALYRSLVNEAGDPGTLYGVVRRLAESERTSPAARAGVALNAALRLRGVEPPPELLRVGYPLAYADLTSSAADEQDVPPLLLLALVRQESFYDPEAGSSAGALGLTQVIEPTGVAIADSLGIEPFELTDLYRPGLSLRFGASYIGDQLRAFDGNIYHALAAYNGGPGTARNAIETAGDDVDLFVEDLEFDETRLYVKLVTENYARYRQLYEPLDRPSLPD